MVNLGADGVIAGELGAGLVGVATGSAMLPNQRLGNSTKVQ
jgi:hypothetical protein